MGWNPTLFCSNAAVGNDLLGEGSGEFDQTKLVEYPHRLGLSIDERSSFIGGL